MAPGYRQLRPGRAPGDATETARSFTVTPPKTPGLYDIRQYPDDIEKLIAGLSYNHRAAAFQSIGTEPLEQMELSIANYSDRGFLVTAYEAWAGRIAEPLSNSYLRRRSETGAALQTDVFEKMTVPLTERPFFGDESTDDFVDQCRKVLEPSYTCMGVRPSWKRVLKKEVAVLLFDPSGKDPWIVLMVKKYEGGPYCAGISMSTDGWLTDSGFTPDKDADGGGICAHISDIHTDVCKMSTGTGDDIGPEISVTLRGICVKVRAGAWAGFTIWDA